MHVLRDSCEMVVAVPSSGVSVKFTSLPITSSIHVFVFFFCFFFNSQDEVPMPIVDSAIEFFLAFCLLVYSFFSCFLFSRRPFSLCLPILQSHKATKYHILGCYTSLLFVFVFSACVFLVLQKC